MQQQQQALLGAKQMAPAQQMMPPGASSILHVMKCGDLKMAAFQESERAIFFLPSALHASQMLVAYRDGSPASGHAAAALHASSAAHAANALGTAAAAQPDAEVKAPVFAPDSRGSYGTLQAVADLCPHAHRFAPQHQRQVPLQAQQPRGPYNAGPSHLQLRPQQQQPRVSPSFPEAPSHPAFQRPPWPSCNQDMSQSMDPEPGVHVGLPACSYLSMNRTHSNTMPCQCRSTTPTRLRGVQLHSGSRPSPSSNRSRISSCASQSMAPRSSASCQ